MTGRIAIDFGTSNTVIAQWDPERKEGVPFALAGYTRSTQQNGETVHTIPSLIHYGAERQVWIGNQVVERGLAESPRTFRWMKRYISNRSPIRLQIDDREITPSIAGQDFLSSLLIFTAQELSLEDEEIGLSVPVEAFEHYENWLARVAESAGLPRFRLIDEPSAAALGYGAHIQPGSVYLIFDFGGGTLHASVILIESAEQAADGRRCRVLGKAGRDVGGTVIDQWLFQEVLRRNHRHDSEEGVRRVSTALLIECQRVKEALSQAEAEELTVLDPITGTVLSASFTRADFEALLDSHQLFTDVLAVVRSAINDAAERGYREEDIQSVLMVGGSSQIPSIQRILRQFFGAERVHSNRPLDAVARGAAAFVAGVDFFDHIQHNYAIRFVDPQKGAYDYRVIIPKGTAYPTEKPIARLTIKASYDGQEKLGIALFEMSASRPAPSAAVELVFDPSGAARLTAVTPHEQEQRSLFWMNEHQPTFLNAMPVAQKSQPRFEVEFNIDQNKRLTLTARDLLSGQLTHQDYPVIRLS